MTNLTRISFIFFFLGVAASAWNIFPLLSNSKVTFENFAKQKISSLKNFRGIFNTPKQHQNNVTSTESTSGTRTTTIKTMTSLPFQEVSTEGALPFDTDDFFNLSSIGNPPVSHFPIHTLEELAMESENLTSKNSVDNFIDKLALSTQEINSKLSSMRDTIEPKVKKFFSEKYNSLLSNLVPYSETIGVPTYVLNSLKIPQNFDPRFQQILSTLKALATEKNTNNLNDEDSSTDGADASIIQSRSDDQELVSDQEPDATGQKKYQHVYLASKNRPNKAYVIPDRNGYEISFDSVSPMMDQETLESSLYSKGYYIEDDPYTSSSDLYTAAGDSIGRRHHNGISRGGHGHGGYGHGHGHGGGYGNGLMDPFTILGSLAFLTYLGLLIQQSLNRTTGTGRTDEWELDFENLSRRIPVMLTKLHFDDKSQSPAVTSATMPTEQLPQSSLTHVPHVHKVQPLRKPALNLNPIINPGNGKCDHFCQVLRKLRYLKELQQPKPTLNFDKYSKKSQRKRNNKNKPKGVDLIHKNSSRNKSSSSWKSISV